MVERVTVIPERREVGIKCPGPAERPGRENPPWALRYGLRRLSRPLRFATDQTKRRDAYARRFMPALVARTHLWFLDDLPLVIATRDRFLRLKSEMNPGDWDSVYGDNVRILNEDIVAAFRPEQIDAAAERARQLDDRVLIVAQGVLG